MHLVLSAIAWREVKDMGWSSFKKLLD